MNGIDYVLIVIGMGLVTFGPRWLPLLVLPGIRMPSWIEQWLAMIPVAILSALLVPELVTTGDPRRLEPLSIELMVALPTFLFALKTKSLGATVMLGMLLYWGAGKL
jgi:branched-subunit amino acid transport protein